MNKRFILLFLFLLNITIVGIVATKFFILPSRAIGSFSILARHIVDRCHDASYKPTCYEEEIPKLMKDISMEEAFAVTKVVQDLDQSYKYCHVVGHKLSEQEVAKDPSKWKEVLSRCPSGVCSNGCIHGGFQERFRKEHFTDADIQKYLPDLKSICEESKMFHPTGLEQASCYHALGHLTMYITRGEIDKSVSLCDEITLKPDGRDFSQLCYDGAFMQIFQPLEPDDFDLIRGKQPTKETVKQYCERYPGRPKDSCVSESWPMFRNELMANSQKVLDLCTQSSTENQNRCYTSLFYVLTAQFNFDTTKMIPYCASLPSGVRDLCFANASSRLIETDYRNIRDSVSLCTEAQKYGSGEACFRELVFYADYNFHQGSEEKKALCTALPKKWQDQCSDSNSSIQRPFIHE